jgi:hypothetical protein
MFIALLLAATLAAPPAPEKPIAFTPDALVWGDGPPSLPPGSKSAVLEGNPRAEGIFTMRIRVPAGSALGPHWHPRHERVTVLSGTVELGFGSVASTTSVTRYGAGSFYVNPPRVMHYLYFPEATEIQLTGHGPWEIHTTDSGAPDGEKASATVVLRNITPPAGAELTGETELVANVDYNISNFRPETFYLTLQFESTVPNQTFTSSGPVISRDGQPPVPPQPKMLASAIGTTTITQPMDVILRSTQLKRPIRVRVSVHEEKNDSSSTVVGKSDWIEYR